MKKALFSLLLITCVASYTQAQLLSYGLKAGVSSSKVSMDQVRTGTDGKYSFESGDAKMGWHAGLYLRVNVPIIGLYVQPEVLYSRSGGKINVSFDSNDNVTKKSFDSEVADFTYSRLDVPVMVGYKFAKVARIFLGPVLSYHLSTDTEWPDQIENVKENYKSSTLGWQGGVGLDIGKIQIDAKYEGNLSKLEDGGLNIGGLTGFKPDTRSSQFILSLGYRL